MNEWAEKEINQMMNLSTNYKEKAMLITLTSYIEQLDKRIAQYEHEIDSKMWQPSKW